MGLAYKLAFCFGQINYLFWAISFHLSNICLIKIHNITLIYKHHPPLLDKFPCLIASIKEDLEETFKMKIELPLENWVDLFGSVPRDQLVRLLPQIDDRQFALFLQFFLNTYGEITIGEFWIKMNGGSVVLQKCWTNILPLADLPMPKNIKNFQQIGLRHFDDSVIAFLREFQRNSLLKDVCVNFYPCSNEDLLAFLINVMPVVSSIDSINIGWRVDLYKQEYSELAKTMLLSARVLEAWQCKYQDRCCDLELGMGTNSEQNAESTCKFREELFCNWLHTPRKNGEKPRVLVLHYWPFQSKSSFVENITKNFLEATKAVTFFIDLTSIWASDNIQFITLDNVQTQEKLMFKRNDNHLLISRYPMGMDGNMEWIDEMRQVPDYKYRHIIVRLD